MTWLFTQVWLWSLAAFALGSLLTWLLFVLPLQRKLGTARARIADMESGTVAPYRDYGEDDESPMRAGEQEYTAWDLLHAEHGSKEHPEQSRDADWLLREDAAETTTEIAAVGVAVDDGESRREHGHGAQPRARQRGGHTYPEERQGHFAGDPVLHWDEWVEAVRQTQTPNAPAEEQESPDTEFIQPSSSPDTRAPTTDVVAPGDWPGAQDDPDSPGTVEVPAIAEHGRTGGAGADRNSDSEADDPELSGQLRSLFDPLVSPGIEQGRRDTPYVPPVGAEKPQTSGDAATGAPESRESLPRRIPGTTSKPGTPPRNGVAAPKFRPERSAQPPAAPRETGTEAAPGAEVESDSDNSESESSS
ncbi:hypothetical protein [Haloactinomyces albus]|uniref:Uncharacterized protein n=1 Tax=Haloactinomyces albus TaxID=1352928 RepID=A0AAE3ZFQ3_9ACTN|nr:hypothetical protein [Haloactinomyces albus]MDR7302407.1 hypothetical protein [Haloactinomyces albus]